MQSSIAASKLRTCNCTNYESVSCSIIPLLRLRARLNHHGASRLLRMSVSSPRTCYQQQTSRSSSRCDRRLNVEFIGIVIGFVAGGLARLLLLRVDYRQYPSAPHAMISHLTFGLIAAAVGA